jgi:multiple sugar transport system permease protein
MHQREALDGYLFISPWIVGFLAFVAGPMLISFYISFTYTTGVSTPRWIGLANYTRMFTEDPLFYTTLWNTLYYVAFSVPLTMAFAIFVAMLLNQRIPGMAFFRTVYYLPSVVPAVASAVLWLQIFHTRFGLLNIVLGRFGLPRIPWLASVVWVKPALIMMSLWGFGGAVVIYLAGLQGIPVELYEAAQIDGAGAVSRMRHITLPLLTPVIFFNLIVGVIGAMQVFMSALLMTNGGPRSASRFFVLHIFHYAFAAFDFSYGAALSWILLGITVVLTYILFKVVGPRVHYYL